MKNVIENIYQKYNYYFTELADPRTNNWFLVSSPGPILVLLLSYYLFCTWLGPSLMKNRKPFELRNTLILYNAVQVLMSIFMLSKAWAFMFSDKFNLKCSLLDYSDNPIAVELTEGCWWYFFGKLTELLDTIFFVLRKKERQISTLHLFHHSLMPAASWFALKYVPGGHGSLFAIINTFVHVIMYSYYFVSALGPQFEKYLWWKKYLTSLQLIQFFIIFLHNFYPLFTDCQYPKHLNIILIVNSLIFMNMFGNFYYQAYIKNDGSQLKKSALNNTKKLR